MRVGVGANVARINVSETITALWTFAHANGISLDDIIERTAGVGVTIDGVRLVDMAVLMRGLALAGDVVMGARVIGDTADRFVVAAGGAMTWGDGAGARDTNLFRDTADVLKTADSLEVAGVLGVIADIITERTAAAGVTIDGVKLKDRSVSVPDLPAAGNIAIESAVAADAEFRYRRQADGTMLWGDGALAPDTNLYRSAPSVLKTDDTLIVGGILNVEGTFQPAGSVLFSLRTPAQITGNVNNYAIGQQVIQRVSASGAFSITGFAGGIDGKTIIVTNVGVQIITLKHADAGSAAANRMTLPNSADIILNAEDAAGLFYDDTTSRWRAIGVAV